MIREAELIEIEHKYEALLESVELLGAHAFGKDAQTKKWVRLAYDVELDADAAIAGFKRLIDDARKVRVIERSAAA
jgi:hypothetical protein